MNKFCHSLKSENAKASIKTFYSDSVGLGELLLWDEPT